MADETPAPLSDAEIAEVRQGIVGAQEEMRAYSPIASIKADRFNEVSHFDHLCANMYVFQVVPRLLATLAARDARLAALEHENAAMREIVAAVADVHTNDMRRAVVGAPALITRARALLATQTPATGATAGEEGEA